MFATDGTSEMLDGIGVANSKVSKTRESSPNALELIENGVVDPVFNIPRQYDQVGRPDGYLIRRKAVECIVPLLIDLPLARAVIDALNLKRSTAPTGIAWN